MLNYENLDRMIAEKYISVQRHPEFDLYIYNYTPKAQYDRVWNNETLQCRGLIMDGNRNVVSRPFRKFFNWGEEAVSKTRNLQKKVAANAIDFTVTEKMDGSLGISYFGPDGKMYIATRGSFVSEQAKKANEILARYEIPAGFWQPTYTYLFEIVYPANRIVVNYGSTEALVYLTAIETATGVENPLYDTMEHFTHIPVVKRYDGITDFEKIEQRPNSEGYVVHFTKDNLRLKIKFDEYVRLHKILTGINAKRIWEIVKSGQSLDDILDRVPDEFYAWVNKTYHSLLTEYNTISDAAGVLYLAAQTFDNRKDIAIWLREHPKYAPIVFRMLDGKEYSNIIWDMLEPPFEKPFKIDEV